MEVKEMIKNIIIVILVIGLIVMTTLAIMFDNNTMSCEIEKEEIAGYLLDCQYLLKQLTKPYIDEVKIGT